MIGSEKVVIDFIIVIYILVRLCLQTCRGRRGFIILCGIFLFSRFL
jgi:hypothetical protein